MNSNLHLDIALTKCFFCGESDRILIAGMKRSSNLKLISGNGELESNANVRVVDMEPCPKCRKWMKQGIILIGIDDAKSTPGWHQPGPDDEHWMPNPYRSGHFAVIKDTAFVRVFNPEDAATKFGLKNRWMFIKFKAGLMIGIWKEETNE